LLVVSVVFSFSSRFAQFMDGDSVIYRNSTRVSRVFYGSAVVGYSVSLETQQRSVPCVSHLSFILHGSILVY